MTGTHEDVFSLNKWSSLGLALSLTDHLEGQLGYSAPTHIQKAAIPALLAGQDVLVHASTGTGKTLVYLAPILHYLQAMVPRMQRADGTCALILAPTRELCLQIHAVATLLAKRFFWVVPGYVMGGENKNKEKARLRKGVTLLVATPGRLLDHLRNTQAFRIANLHWLVLDEADRLLDLGFEKDIVEILGLLDHSSGHPRQTVLLSATLTSRVTNLANLSLKEPLSVGLDPPPEITIEAAQEGGEEKEVEYQIPSQLSQTYLKVPCRLRLALLAAFLRWKAQGPGPCKLVVFFSTCDSVEFHASVLSSFRFSAHPHGRRRTDTDGHGPADESPFVPCDIFKLHGNLMQKDRAEAFFAFGRATSGVLFCTDVAARGLDFPTVTGIVQFDPAGEASDYVHRVGRTARLGQRGEAVLFLQGGETEYLGELQRHKVDLGEQAVGPIVDSIPRGRGGRFSGEGGSLESHPGPLALQAALEAYVGSQATFRQLAVDSFRSFVRAYAAHRGALKRIFHPRRLHLGHVAKSFGLQVAPSLLGQSTTKAALAKRKEEKVANWTRKKKRLKAAAMGE